MKKLQETITKYQLFASLLFGGGFNKLSHCLHLTAYPTHVESLMTRIMLMLVIFCFAFFPPSTNSCTTEYILVKYLGLITLTESRSGYMPPKRVTSGSHQG